ncbi:LAQU0S06e02806g1_1 [Lachancea quebecensis]|uniref:LAQU0S06e02806g1_1 n=1 Tax=Lachancea quebecensis TaxID=1654605 RepID=A0A0P1KS60_9SACH|nr:LAQU0S06e02806g1_1 [Lachancea quebecensis]
MRIPPPTLVQGNLAPDRVRLYARASESSFPDNGCFGFSCGNQWVWGRWILLVFFLCFLAVLAFTAVKLNGKRSNRGQRPIPGTAWFTPPTYRQSERQFRGSTQDYVPPYTETANDNDLGYYDNRGVFHFNIKAEEGPPPPLDDTTSFNADNLQYPPRATTRVSQNTSRQSLDNIRDFNEYYYGAAAASPHNGPTGVTVTRGSSSIAQESTEIHEMIPTSDRAKPRH